uniref:Uncharacterized protein n=1 Tax=Mesocestoides corti TaxID=53468 RepID=A0A5K3FNE6_MESCO
MFKECKGNASLPTHEDVVLASVHSAVVCLRRGRSCETAVAAAAAATYDIAQACYHAHPHAFYRSPLGRPAVKLPLLLTCARARVRTHALQVRRRLPFILGCAHVRPSRRAWRAMLAREISPLQLHVCVPMCQLGKKSGLCLEDVL